MTRTATIRAAALVAVVAASACTPERGYHPESDVPENQARVHQPDYQGGEIEAGELQPPEAEPETVRGEPPIGVEAEWAPSEADGPQWRITTVYIDVGLAELCGIETAKAHFDYDSARLDDQTSSRIAAIADCFIDGPLSGRDVTIIGHTDPRGTDAYNRELGMSRAESVAQALTREGLVATRIDVESVGEAQASADPAEWPDDRRVDLQIAD